VVHQPAFPAHKAIGHPPDPAEGLNGDLEEDAPDLGLLDACDFAVMALGTALLVDQPGWGTL
jgi:hypothetical protein